MLKSLLVLAGVSLLTGASSSPTELDYLLRVDSTDLTGIWVDLRIANAPAGIRLAAHAHPEYDDKYWRYIEDVRAVDGRGGSLTAVREDSVRWRVDNAGGDVVVRYRVRFPSEGALRPPWRPFLAATGGLVGGPHSFLYVIGHETAAASVTLDLDRKSTRLN